MTRAIWLCLRCGWRRPVVMGQAPTRAMEASDRRHESRCPGAVREQQVYARYIEHGRITGGARSRQP